MMGAIPVRRVSVNDLLAESSAPADDEQKLRPARRELFASKVSPDSHNLNGVAAATQPADLPATATREMRDLFSPEVNNGKGSCVAAPPTAPGKSPNAASTAKSMSQKMPAKPMVMGGEFAAKEGARVDVMIACNAIKTFAPVASAAQSRGDAKMILEFAERVAIRAFELIGVVDDNKIDFNLPRVLPTSAKIASELYLENPASLQDELIFESTAEALAMSASSKQAHKLAPDVYISAGAATDLRISLMAATSSAVAEVILFRFSKKIKNDIDFIAGEVMRLSAAGLPGLVPGDASEQVAVTMAQSLIRNSFDVMGVCWRRQAVLAMSHAPGGTKKEVIDAIHANSDYWHGEISQDFNAAMRSIIELTALRISAPEAVKRSRTRMSQTFA